MERLAASRRRARGQRARLRLAAKRSWVSEIRDDRTVVAPGQCLPDFQLDVLRDGPDAAIAKGDVGDPVQAAHPRQPAEAAAADVGPLVVKGAVAAEGALEEAAVHPAGAPISRDVLVVLP